MIGTALLVWVAQAAAAAPAPEFDLLLKNGHVIDPANTIDGRMDVAVAGGKVAAVAKNIAAVRAKQTVDVKGFFVTPGLIDIHAHVYVGYGRRPSHPADLHLAAGVTTLVDAGTWGAKDFHLMRQHVIKPSRVRVLAMLNITSGGMERDGAEQDVAQMDAKLCAETIKQNRDVIVGIKTAHYWTQKPWDAAHPPWASVERAVEAGTIADVPVMVDFWPRPPERPYADLILKKLRPGDMHTHVFAQQFPIINADGKLNQVLLEARKRGVLFDLGHGAASFWFRNAAPAIKQGFLPDSISTDLHQNSANGPVIDMTTTMSKILALGVPFPEVIRRSTVNPARQIRRPELGTLSVGRDADIAVLELRRGRFNYVDSGKATASGVAKIENRLTVRAGRILYDPTGLAMVDWKKAPKEYFVSPVLQPPPPPEP